MKYKGYEIKDSRAWWPYRCKAVHNDAGIVRNRYGELVMFSTTEECKEWINNSPIEDYEVYFFVGDHAAVVVFDEEGIKALKKADNGYEVCYVADKRTYRSLDEVKAFQDAVCVGEAFWCNDFYRALTREEYQYLIK